MTLLRMLLRMHRGGFISVTALGSAAGRTMSPVSAVALMCGTMTQTNQIDLCKRVCVPLLAGLVAVVTVSFFLMRLP